MPKRGPTLEVELQYGFAHYWTLVLPATRTLPQQRFYLGQDVKFASRVLGMDGLDLAEEVFGKRAWPGPIDGDEYVSRKVAAYIVKVMGGMRRLRGLQPWELSAE